MCVCVFVVTFIQHPTPVSLLTPSVSLATFVSFTVCQLRWGVPGIQLGRASCPKGLAGLWGGRKSHQQVPHPGNRDGRRGRPTTRHLARSAARLVSEIQQQARKKYAGNYSQSQRVARKKSVVVRGRPCGDFSVVKWMVGMPRSSNSEWLLASVAIRNMTTTLKSRSSFVWTHGTTNCFSRNLSPFPKFAVSSTTHAGAVVIHNITTKTFLEFIVSNVVWPGALLGCDGNGLANKSLGHSGESIMLCLFIY